MVVGRWHCRRRDRRQPRQRLPVVARAPSRVAASPQRLPRTLIQSPPWQRMPSQRHQEQPRHCPCRLGRHLAQHLHRQCLHPRPAHPRPQPRGKCAGGVRRARRPPRRCRSSCRTPLPRVPTTSPTCPRERPPRQVGELSLLAEAKRSSGEAHRIFPRPGGTPSVRMRRRPGKGTWLWPGPDCRL